MSGYYTNYSKFLNEVVESRNYELVKHILNVMELLPDYNKEQTMTIAKKQFESDDPKMIEIFTDKFGISSKNACDYIVARSRDLTIDRDGVDEVVPKLGNHYGSALASACLIGDLEIAEKIAKHYEYTPVTLATVKTHIGYSYQANGEVVSLKGETMRKLPAAELKKLMILMHRVGLDGIVGINTPDFWANLDTEIQASTYEGELPSIGRDGAIDNPELLIAFEAEGKGKPYANIYDRVPCWIHDSLLSSIHSKRVYESKTLFHRDASYSAAGPFDFDIRDLYAVPEIIVPGRRGDDVPLSEAFGTLTLGLDAKDKLPELAPSEITAEYSIKHKQHYCDNTQLLEMLPSAIALGIDTRPGYSLVMANIQEIGNYTIKGVDSAKLDNAVDYAKNFLPRSLLQAKNGLLPERKIPQIGLHKAYSTLLFTRALEGPARERLLSMFPRKFWVSMFNKCASNLPAKILAKSVKEWGFDNRDARLDKLTPEDVDILHSIGFKAHPDGYPLALDITTVNKDKSFTFGHRVKFVQIGGTKVGGIEMPASTEECLKLATRTKKHNSYDVFLVAGGAEAAVSVASTPAQWELIKTLFTTQDLLPYADKIPLSQRAIFAEDSLGL